MNGASVKGLSSEELFDSSLDLLVEVFKALLMEELSFKVSFEEFSVSFDPLFLRVPILKEERIV